MKDVLVPVYTTTLIGRARETAEVVALINNPDIQLVTLTGASGTGKTRLSTEIEAALTNQGFQVVFVPLAAINKPEFVLPAIAQQLGVRESGSMEMLDLLIKHLNQEPLILILDNFEQVLSAGQELERLIQAVPELNVLVTSQEPLLIKAETVFMIPGLDVPTTIPETPEAALQCAAVQLFVQRIQAVQPNFQLLSSNVEPVVEICQMLEGLPLAIEIVAAHSGVLLPRDLKLLVKQHLMLYRFRAKGATGRQRILLPIIEWSLSRLPDHAQDLFKHLGVFQGGWMFDALEAVVHDSYDLQATLNLLAERHLILKQATNDDDLRFMMLDAVQDFANMRFVQLPLAERTMYVQRHMSFLFNLAQAAQTDLMNGVNQRAWINRFNQEMPNIRFLMDWAIQSEPRSAADLSLNLGRFWYMSGHWKEGVHWYSQVNQVANLSASQSANIAASYAILLRSLSRFDVCEQVAQSGITAAQESGELFAEGRLYNTLGLIYLDRQDYSLAKQYLERSLQISKELDNQFLLSVALGNLANIELNERNYAGALARYEEAQEIARKYGQKMSEMINTCNIGCVYIAMRKPDLAIPPLTEVIEAAKIIQSKDLYGACLYFKANALLLGKLPGVGALIEESIQVLHELGSLVHLCQALDAAAALFEHQGFVKQVGLIVGAVDSARDELHAQRKTTSEDPVFDDMLERVKDSDVFQKARVEGQAWNLEQAVSYVLKEVAPLRTA